MGQHKRKAGQRSEDSEAMQPPSIRKDDHYDEDKRIPSEASRDGIYLFLVEMLCIAIVFSKALHHNQGKKFIRVIQEGCHQAWAELSGDHTIIACCSHTEPHDPLRWDAGICEAARSPATSHLTSRLAIVIPLMTLLVNSLFSRGQAKEVQEAQRHRFVLYNFIIFFRTAILLIVLNRVQAHVQAHESDICWYSGLRHDKRCRESFDFADHGVLFISQYLAIQTFECLAVLREATSLFHLLACLASVGVISISSLSGLYATVSFFHTRLESIAGLVISIVTVQIPLLLIISGKCRKYKWLRLDHYVTR